MSAARNGPSKAIINHVDASGSQNRRMSRWLSVEGLVIVAGLAPHDWRLRVRVDMIHCLYDAAIHAFVVVD